MVGRTPLQSAGGDEASAEIDAEPIQFRIGETQLQKRRQQPRRAVVAAVQQRLVRQQIDATNEMVAAMNKSLDILKYQLDKGYASGVDYAAQKAATAAAAATLPPLAKQDAQLRDQMAVLVGRFVRWFILSLLVIKLGPGAVELVAHHAAIAVAIVGALAVVGFAIWWMRRKRAVKPLEAAEPSEIVKPPES